MPVIEDTALLVLLRLHADPTSDQKEGTCREFGIYDGFRMLWVHKSVIYYRLLMLQLDATSSHIGKGVALRKLSSDANFTITAKVFSNDASLDDIVLAGELVPCCLYGSRSSEVLDALLYIHFTEKVTRRTTNVQLHSLPPAAAAAVHHNARVYF